MLVLMDLFGWLRTAGGQQTTNLNCFKLVHKGRGSIRVATSSENRFRNGKCDGV